MSQTLCTLGLSLSLSVSMLLTQLPVLAQTDPAPVSFSATDLRQGSHAIHVDGKHDDWKHLPFSTIRAGGEVVAQVAMAFDDTYIYVAYRVRDATPMMNRLQDPPHHFKEGDALDFMIGPWRPRPRHPIDGDARVLLVPVPDHPVVVVYRQRAAAADPQWNHTFSSPIRRVSFDSVRIYHDPHVVSRRTNTGYASEARIPIAWLGLESLPERLIGDMGVLLSDEGGMRTTRRCNLIHTSADTVSDIPTEAELTPDGWGEILITQPGSVP